MPSPIGTAATSSDPNDRSIRSTKAGGSLWWSLPSTGKIAVITIVTMKSDEPMSWSAVLYHPRTSESTKIEITTVSISRYTEISTALTMKTALPRRMAGDLDHQPEKRIVVTLYIDLANNAKPNAAVAAPTATTAGARPPSTRTAIVAIVPIVRVTTPTSAGAPVRSSPRNAAAIGSDQLAKRTVTPLNAMITTNTASGRDSATTIAKPSEATTNAIVRNTRIGPSSCNPRDRSLAMASVR